MFRNALHASVGGQAQRLDARGLRRRPAAVVGFIAEAAFAAVVVALFLGWLMSGRASGSLAAEPNASVSAGAALFARRPRGRLNRVQAPHPEDNCMSLGKGGRLCFARPARAGS